MIGVFACSQPHKLSSSRRELINETRIQLLLIVEHTTIRSDNLILKIKYKGFVHSDWKFFLRKTKFVKFFQVQKLFSEL